MAAPRTSTPVRSFPGGGKFGPEQVSGLKTMVLGAVKGKTNNTGTLTLDANQASTTITCKLCTKQSHVTLTPTSANASADFGSGAFYVTPGHGSFVITHPNNANADKTFSWMVNG